MVKYDKEAYERAWELLASSSGNSEDVFSFSRHIYFFWEKGEIRLFWTRLFFFGRSAAWFKHELVNKKKFSSKTKHQRMQQQKMNQIAHG